MFSRGKGTLLPTKIEVLPVKLTIGSWERINTATGMDQDELESKSCYAAAEMSTLAIRN